jgi:hypothetical protein
MTDKIPFIISTAYPDYRRACLLQDFGTCYRNEIPDYFINTAAEFIFERIDYEDLNEANDIKNFWNSYYDDYYMDNVPWEANIFIDGKWLNIIPSDEEIFERIKKLKIWKAEEWKAEDIERDCNRQTELSDEDDSIMEEEKNGEFYKLTQDETDVINQMQEYFEHEGFHVLDQQNKSEEIVRLINEFIIKTKNKEFQENRTLFASFTNELIKCIEKDVEKITSDLEIIHNEENSKKLHDIMRVYASLLTYKDYFKI